MARIAVEKPLTDVQEALAEKGYQVEMVDHVEENDSYDIVVVRALEEYKDLPTKANLVGVSGRSTDEVLEEVESLLNKE